MENVEVYSDAYTIRVKSSRVGDGVLITAAEASDATVGREIVQLSSSAGAIQIAHDHSIPFRLNVSAPSIDVTLLNEDYMEIVQAICTHVQVAFETKGEASQVCTALWSRTNLLFRMVLLNLFAWCTDVYL